MYFGVMHGKTTYEGTKNFLELVHKCCPDKPILDQEYSMWCTPVNNYWNDMFQLTVPEDENGQIQFFDDIMKAFKEKSILENDNGYLIGCTWWTICDWYTSHNVPVNTLSLMSIHRNKPYKVFSKFNKQYAEFLKELSNIRNRK